MKQAILLYQIGIANVFAVVDGELRRIQQHVFGPCEWFCRGLRAAGVDVKVMHWDGTGDALLFRDDWQPGYGEIFASGKTHL